MLGFPVREHPYVGSDARVVEHVERQGDNSLQPVVLDDPASDVALALSRGACEEGAAVVDLDNAASEPRSPLHFGEHVG